MSDREKVNAWLKSICEFDAAVIAEVLQQCASDPGARAYFVKRHDLECTCSSAC